VTKSRSRKLEEVYIMSRNKQIVFISQKGCTWDYNCYCLMDYFASEYKAAFDEFSVEGGGLITDVYNSRLDEFLFINRSDLTVDLQIELETPGHFPLLRNVYCKTFTRNIREMLKHPCLKYMTGKILKSTIEKASSFMVKTKYQFLSEGKFRIDNRLKRDYSNSFDGLAGLDFYNLFNVIPKILKVGKDKKNYNVEYKFSFDTILGALFIHNISCRAYHLIEDNFYSLSKNANLLYRKRFIVLRDKSTNLRMDTVLSDLCLTNKNFYESKKKFISIVEELVDNKLIYISKVTYKGKIPWYSAITAGKDSNKNKVIEFKQKAA
jgi:hypothetical protein